MTITVLAVAQLVSPLVKYPRWKAANAPITSQINRRTAPMLPVLLLPRVRIRGNYPGAAPTCRALDLLSTAGHHDGGALCCQRCHKGGPGLLVDVEDAVAVLVGARLSALLNCRRAFVGLRTDEAVGLPIVGVDVMRGIVRPTVQSAGEELKTETSRTPLPIPQELTLELSASVARWGSDYVVTDGQGRQASTWAIERVIRAARPKIDGLPAGFRFHDLRHYLASLLIGSGLDVKVVQHRLRHGSA